MSLMTAIEIKDILNIKLKHKNIKQLKETWEETNINVKKLLTKS